MVPSPLRAVEAHRSHAAARAAALLELKARAERGERECVADLIRAAADDPALMGLHVWRIERAAFARSDAMCLRHVRQAAEWSGSPPVRAGSARLSWLLDARTGGARLAAWLLAVCLDLDVGFSLPGPDPYAAMRQTVARRAAAVPSDSHTS